MSTIARLSSLAVLSIAMLLTAGGTSRIAWAQPPRPGQGGMGMPGAGGPGAGGPGMPEPARRELSGQIAGISPLALMVLTEDGPVNVLYNNGLNFQQAAPFGGFQGLDQLFQPLGAGGAPVAPIPTEWQIRVTTTIDVLQPNDVLRFQAQTDPRSGIPLRPVKVLELYAQGVGADNELVAAEGEDPWMDVRVERRQGREVQVRNGPRRQNLPVDRNVVVRTTSSDPRWLAIGDRVEMVVRVLPDNQLQAVRVRATHRDPAVTEEVLPEDDPRLVALGFGDRLPVEPGEEPGAMPGGAGAVAGGGLVEPIRPGLGRGVAGAVRMAEGEADASAETPPNVAPSPLGDGGRAFGRRIRIN